MHGNVFTATSKLLGRAKIIVSHQCSRKSLSDLTIGQLRLQLWLQFLFGSTLVSLALRRHKNMILVIFWKNVMLFKKKFQGQSDIRWFSVKLFSQNVFSLKLKCTRILPTRWWSSNWMHFPSILGRTIFYSAEHYFLLMKSTRPKTAKVNGDFVVVCYFDVQHVNRENRHL